MRFLCLCPTYGRPPNLIREAISHFINQTHTNAYLLVYDDLGNYQVHTGDRWAVLSTSCREPGIVAKYETMLRVARHIEQVGTIDAIALWDDDDVYLPKHLEHHARVLDRYEFSYPSKVLSTYTGTIAEEASGGRFWASCAIRAKSFSDVGGFVRTERARLRPAKPRPVASPAFAWRSMCLRRSDIHLPLGRYWSTSQPRPHAITR